MIEKKMKILMVSPELTPWAKSGGLGDMVSALSIALAKQGHDVKIILPLYGSIDRSLLTKHEAPLSVPLGFAEEWCAVYSCELNNSSATIYFIDHDLFFGSRGGIYGDNPESSYGDNSKRFTFFSRAAFQLCKYLHWQPNIMHAHDWAAALVPLFLYTWERYGFFEQTASVYTVHNLAYQGWFPKDDIVYAQLSWTEYFSSGLERFDCLNFMQAGLANADILTTVSPTYANEVKTAEFGCGLEAWFNRRHIDLFGVLNGIDYDEWNPETDPYIAPYNYSRTSLDKKLDLKEQLQKELGLVVNREIPLISMVGRLVKQKGIDALLIPGQSVLHQLASEFKVQFVIVGTGEKWCEDELTKIASLLPNVKVFITFRNDLAHKVEAASDFFLMPSRYEPCGLNQMYSLRYGTLPIVRRTGGLNDSIVNFDNDQNGTGFMFDYFAPKAILDTVTWAIHTYYNNKSAIKAMQQQAMQQNVSWSKSSKIYEEIYQWAIDRRLGLYNRSW